MVVGCAGHAALLTIGFGGLGAVAAAVSGNTAALTTAVALVGVVGGLAALRIRRRTRCDTANGRVPASGQPSNRQEER